MKNRKIFRCIMCVSIISCLSGCSLAVPDAGTEGGSDRMIGVFITRDFLDLFDMEQYINDHSYEFVNGGEIQIASDARYEGKLYASVDKSKGDDPYDWEISFGDLDGISMFTPLWESENGETYRGTVCTEEISDPDFRYNVTDDGDENIVSGKVYILAGKFGDDRVYYANPVYQTEDGEIYVTCGHGFSSSGGSSEGVNFSSTVSGETTVTENGKAKTEKSSVTVQYKVINEPVRFTFCQMDQEHQVIKKGNYRPEEVPEQIHAEKDAAYIVVEMEKEGTEGEKIVSREVYDQKADEDTWLTTFCAREDGIVVEQETKVIWK